MQIKETRFTRNAALSLSLREKSGRFNVSFAVATAGNGWSFFMITLRKDANGKRLHWMNW